MSTDGPTISVVIPAYNAEKYVGRAVESILAQTHSPDEIIIVDDGSTDGTAQVVRLFEDKVTFIQQQNAGASVARNSGIEAARGEWIAFLDADDEWLPQKLQRQIEHLRKRPDLVWTHSNYFVRPYPDGGRAVAFTPAKYAETLRNGDYFDDYLDVHPEVCIRTSTVIVKRAVLKETGLFRIGQFWAQDTDMFLRIAYANPAIGFLPEPLAVYYADVPNSITLKNKQRVSQRCEYLHRHLGLAAEQGRLAAFEPCAGRLAAGWIKGILQEDPLADVGEILDCFGHLMPRDLCREVSLRMKYPRMVPRAMKCYFHIKGKLRSLGVWPKR